ncbi:MAG TPA: tRNA epoxyqueuosine(34) reductase QueG [Bacteroidota bacterium]|nr:tRNA epoxyqueuosine(34) reductase QueG [Bacteroidota bacterium]
MELVPKAYRYSEEIRKESHRLGFDRVGIAEAVPPKAEASRLQTWLHEGRHADMDWMKENVEKRSNPLTVLPSAKSIVVVAMNYYTDHVHDDGPRKGKISRYAWGDDYHDVVKERLDKLLEFIRSFEPAVDGKVYVDTGPVLEKAWAQRAGIGWQGKHTNLITEDFGSWVFLGEILLNLELVYDAPDTDRCGSCTLCIEACPTQAITEPYVLDAGKCISYLTIEHRGEIEPALAAKFDGWIYGCDICQDACPWNQRNAHITARKEFEPRSGNIAPELEDIASLSVDEFQKRFRKSPIKRAKHSGLTRNATLLMKTRQKS